MVNATRIQYQCQRLQPQIKILSELKIFKLKLNENPFIIYKNSSSPSSPKKNKSAKILEYNNVLAFLSAFKLFRPIETFSNTTYKLGLKA